MPNLLYFSQVNCVRFTNQALTFLDRHDFSTEQNKEGFYKSCYAHKMSPGDPDIVIQVATNVAGAHIVKLINQDGTDVAGTSDNGIKKADITGGAEDYEIWEFTIPNTAMTAGKWYQIEADFGGGTKIAMSEWIHFDTHKNTNVFQFTNDKNTPENFFADNFAPWLRLESQIWKRKPASERSYYTNSSNQSMVVAQRNFRKVTAELYNLPPFLYEMVAVMSSLYTIRIEGTDFVSEEGLDEPEYRTRFLLANSSLTLVQKKNFSVDRYQGVLQPDQPRLRSDVLVDNTHTDVWFITSDSGARLRVRRP